MPVFRSRTALDIVRGIRAFLNLEAGTRIARLEKENEELRTRLVAARDEVNGIRAENIVWIFGTGRTGSTWLAYMMADLTNHTLWHEPLVGKLFGDLYNTQVGRRRRNDKHFVLGDSVERRSSIRSFVLNSAGDRFPQARDGGYLIIKEPNGSMGAPPLVEALPESRMIFLVRDLRDVVASFMDANKKGGWLYEAKNETARAKLDTRPENFLKQRANMCVRDITNVKEAYDAHEGRKVLIRYEDLRADTLEVMKHIYTTLELPVDEEELAQIVEKHSWENIPTEKKGEGKFNRKATPGGWQEDFTLEQAALVEEITAPLMKELYPTS